jgi:cobalamin synthase
MSDVLSDADQGAKRNELYLRNKGQRRINGLWEFTQSLVALLVTGVTLYAALNVISKGAADSREMIIFLTNVFFVVIGFYFGRTNHQRTGGIGGDTAGPRSV